MANRISSPIHKRVIVTSVMIIFLLVSSLGLATYLLNKQSYFSVYASELIITVPKLVNELKNDGQFQFDKYIENNPSNNQTFSEGIQGIYL